MSVRETSHRHSFPSTTPWTILRAITASVTILVLLLLAGPVRATELEEVDPDPDSALVLLVVSEREAVDPMTLEPGHYLVIVVAAEGAEWIYEIVVP